MSRLALESVLLKNAGFRHGFSLRAGGVSEGVFASLNFGLAPGRAQGRGDSEANVRENVRRAGAAIGFDPAALYQASQVHGARVLRAGGDASQAIEQEADALVAFPSIDPRAPVLAVGVRVADCTPVLAADLDTGAVTAIHAGWRGVVARVVASGIGALRSPAASQIVAAIGPCIGPCCFEVGADVAARIADACGDASVVIRKSEKPHVDMRRAVRAQLRAMGIKDERIEDIDGCTKCDAARFYSYRRDGDPSGRHLAVIRARG
jgi:YfiH family protein